MWICSLSSNIQLDQKCIKGGSINLSLMKCTAPTPTIDMFFCIYIYIYIYTFLKKIWETLQLVPILIKWLGDLFYNKEKTFSMSLTNFSWKSIQGQSLWGKEHNLLPSQSACDKSILGVMGHYAGMGKSIKCTCSAIIMCSLVPRYWVQGQPLGTKQYLFFYACRLLDIAIIYEQKPLILYFSAKVLIGLDFA